MAWEAKLTKEVLDKVPICSLGLAVSKYNHVDGGLQVAEANNLLCDGEHGVVLHRVEHAGEAGVGSHLEGNIFRGPERAGALVDGAVEGGRVTAQGVVRTAGECQSRSQMIGICRSVRQAAVVLKDVVLAQGIETPG